MKSRKSFLHWDDRDTIENVEEVTQKHRFSLDQLQMHVRTHCSVSNQSDLYLCKRPQHLPSNGNELPIKLKEQDLDKMQEMTGLNVYYYQALNRTSLIASDNVKIDSSTSNKHNESLISAPKEFSNISNEANDTNNANNTNEAQQKRQINYKQNGKRKWPPPHDNEIRQVKGIKFAERLEQTIFAPVVEFSEPKNVKFVDKNGCERIRIEKDIMSVKCGVFGCDANSLHSWFNKRADGSWGPNGGAQEKHFFEQHSFIWDDLQKKAWKQTIDKQYGPKKIELTQVKSEPKHCSMASKTEPIDLTSTTMTTPPSMKPKSPVLEMEMEVNTGVPPPLKKQKLMQHNTNNFNITNNDSSSNCKGVCLFNAPKSKNKATKPSATSLVDPVVDASTSKNSSVNSVVSGSINGNNSNINVCMHQTYYFNRNYSNLNNLNNLNSLNKTNTNYNDLIYKRTNYLHELNLQYQVFANKLKLIHQSVRYNVAQNCQKTIQKAASLFATNENDCKMVELLIIETMNTKNRLLKKLDCLYENTMSQLEHCRIKSILLFASNFKVSSMSNQTVRLQMPKRRICKSKSNKLENKVNTIHNYKQLQQNVNIINDMPARLNVNGNTKLKHRFKMNEVQKHNLEELQKKHIKTAKKGIENDFESPKMVKKTASRHRKKRAKNKETKMVPPNKSKSKNKISKHKHKPHKKATNQHLRESDLSSDLTKSDASFTSSSSDEESTKSRRKRVKNRSKRTHKHSKSNKKCLKSDSSDNDIDIVANEKYETAKTKYHKKVYCDEKKKSGDNCGARMRILTLNEINKRYNDTYNGLICDACNRNINNNFCLTCTKQHSNGLGFDLCMKCMERKARHQDRLRRR